MLRFRKWVTKEEMPGFSLNMLMREHGWDITDGQRIINHSAALNTNSGYLNL